jgi:hypothetical protein
MLPWNFVLTGSRRSGVGAVLAGLRTRTDVVCHAEILAPDALTRERAHTAYFGEVTRLIKGTEWCDFRTMGPWQYLHKTVFGNPKRGELAVGCYVSYEMTDQSELYDLYQQCYREGNFSVVHVLRSPVACYISQKQVEQGTQRPGMPYRVELELPELVSYWRDQLRIRSKIMETCADRMHITYREVLEAYQQTMAELFDFVELPGSPQLVRHDYQRKRNRLMHDRIGNWEIVKRLPLEIQRHIDSADFC